VHRLPELEEFHAKIALQDGLALYPRLLYIVFGSSTLLFFQKMHLLEYVKSKSDSLMTSAFPRRHEKFSGLGQESPRVLKIFSYYPAVARLTNEFSSVLYLGNPGIAPGLANAIFKSSPSRKQIPCTTEDHNYPEELYANSSPHLGLIGTLVALGCVVGYVFGIKILLQRYQFHTQK
jgi:hypothetical protein